MKEAIEERASFHKGSTLYMRAHLCHHERNLLEKKGHVKLDSVPLICYGLIEPIKEGGFQLRVANNQRVTAPSSSVCDRTS